MGKGVEGAGKGLEGAGKGLEGAGKGVEGAVVGKGLEGAGKGVEGAVEVGGEGEGWMWEKAGEGEGVAEGNAGGLALLTPTASVGTCREVANIRSAAFFAISMQALVFFCFSSWMSVNTTLHYINNNIIYLYSAIIFGIKILFRGPCYNIAISI